MGLSFDGDHGNFLTLPESVIPQRAGFTLFLEIKPEHVLFANETYSYGTLISALKTANFNSISCAARRIIRNLIRGHKSTFKPISRSIRANGKSTFLL